MSLKPTIGPVKPDEAVRIGQLVYRNECGSQEKYLVHWNVGEKFMSLGLGHFIWYPAGVEKKFSEIFPQLLHFLVDHNIELPSWLAPDTPAPWKDIDSFNANIGSGEYNDLLELMKNSFSAQVKFMCRRFAAQSTEIITASERPDTVSQRMSSIAANPGGMYLLIDYLNFKGSGLAAAERYAGQGWGLLQVLEEMQEDSSVAFADAAAEILKRRIANSPSGRGEERWLPGWLNRIDSYRNDPAG